MRVQLNTLTCECDETKELHVDTKKEWRYKHWKALEQHGLVLEKHAKEVHILEGALKKVRTKLEDEGTSEENKEWLELTWMLFELCLWRKDTEMRADVMRSCHPFDD